MTPADLLRRRLRNQHVSGPPLPGLEHVIAWLGAVQAQDYPGAKWGVAQRAARVSDAAMDEALASGRLLRTHIMRPTWHFVLPADIRWMLKLTGPRVNTTCGSYYRKLGLDDRLFARSHAALAAALRGGRALTRAELAARLRDAGLTSPRDVQYRLAFILMRAELDAVICSGPRTGRQFTYMLLDERVPRATTLDRTAARAELALRYFRSHGPATLRDFVWWSGLTTADARAGLDAVGSELAAGTVDGKQYWTRKRSRASDDGQGEAFLLPTYDECFVAYRDRPAIDPAAMTRIRAEGGQLIVIDGVVVGTWRRKVGARTIQVQTSPFRSLTRTQKSAIEAAADRYSKFAGVPVTLAGPGVSGHTAHDRQKARKSDRPVPA